MNYRAQIAYDSNKTFKTCQPTFSSEGEALSYAELLAERQISISNYRVVPVTDKPTHIFCGGRAVAVTIG